MYLRAEGEQRGEEVVGDGGSPHQVRFSYPLVWWGPCLVLINLEWIITTHSSPHNKMFTLFTKVTRPARDGSHGPNEAWRENFRKPSLINTFQDTF